MKRRLAYVAAFTGMWLFVHLFDKIAAGITAAQAGVLP